MTHSIYKISLLASYFASQTLENITRIFPNLENITLGELYLVDTFLEQLSVVMASGEGR